MLRSALLLSCVLGGASLSAPIVHRPAVSRPVRALRALSPVCQADEEPGDGGFWGGFGAAAGLFANPIVCVSLYNVAATGVGLPAGDYNIAGTLEGVSFLAVAGIVLAALYSKVTKGSGLPAGPLGLLGLSEGLSFLSLLLALLVFPGREFGLVGDPATAAINVPEVTAQVVATVGPLVSQVIDAAGPLAQQASDAASQAASSSGVDLSTLKLPEVDIEGAAAALKASSGVDLSTLKLPDGVALPDVSSLKLPEGIALPDVSALKLPEGVSLPDVSGLKMPDVSSTAPPAADPAPVASTASEYQSIPKYDPGY